MTVQLLAGRGWWATKLRQFRAHVGASVALSERAELVTWLTSAQLALFDSMPVADRRHGLDVVATIRASGTVDPDLLLAGLFHDAGKGRAVGLWPRVAWSLGERYGSWIWRAARVLPDFGKALDRMRDHAERSAELAQRAGCSPRTVDLIRHQAAPEDGDGAVLQLADEAN
ncbi:MAG TPA: hypothetical protein VEO91_03985 [Candidatus Limnocylindria bacterium]|nr:hypothetical protein [Candidatus Limnocylindria bacterium]